MPLPFDATTILDFLLVVLGFSLIIVIHELGHFLAARWAGIRVMAFAVGFGPALISYRKGLGVRRGSSEAAYLSLTDSRAKRPTTDRSSEAIALESISPTEYRLNLLPFGGYVKMLGQDDADPSARSDAPDSYQRAPVFKRMIVISAGVIFNVILAAILFIIVFTVGLQTEPAKIGEVLPGSPAAKAVAINAAQLGITEAGLRSGDVIVSLNGRAPDSFKDLTLEAAMAAKGSRLNLQVARPGVPGTLLFEIEPREDEVSHMLDLGVGPPASSRLIGARPGERASSRERAAKELSDRGLVGLAPGMTLVGIGAGSESQFERPESTGASMPTPTPYDLVAAVRASDGHRVDAFFRDTSGAVKRIGVYPDAELSRELLETAAAAGKRARLSIDHLAGLTPTMRVEAVSADSAAKAGLKSGDLFARLGDLEWPSTAAGIAEIRLGAKDSIRVTVARPAPGADSANEPTAKPETFSTLDLGSVPVKNGIIGFRPGSSASASTLVSAWPNMTIVPESSPATATAVPPAPPSGARLQLPPGTTIETVDGQRVHNFTEIRAALKAACTRAKEGDVRVALEVRFPFKASPDATRKVDWTLSQSEARSILALGWVSPLGPELFETDKILLKGDSVMGAIQLGFRETNRVMLSTYLTFARLFQGSVKVEHLKGPVGIAHVGTLIADKGFVWLLFFMGVISINLAVVNFLPLPIVDGGQFLFLVYEGLVGKPVSIVVQNVATIAGLVLIGSMFLVVTFNDLANLIWR